MSGTKCHRWAALVIECLWWLWFGHCCALLKWEELDVPLQSGASAVRGQLFLHLLVLTYFMSSCRIKKFGDAQILSLWE